MHHPVLLQNVLEALGVRQGGVYIDATAGEGGHLIEIAHRVGRALGIDRDGEQIKNLKLKIKNYRNIQLVHGNYADIERIVKENGFCPADGVLFDLGLSMLQLKRSGRGFSYGKPEEKLDMRIQEDPEATTAMEIVNSYSEDKLYEIFAHNAEEINSRLIAHALVRARALAPIHTVGALLQVIESVVGNVPRETAARIFQALRMETNDELSNLKKGLEGASRIMRRDGKIAVITFHSVEDRLVKRYIEEGHFISKKIKNRIRTPSYERSAILRVLSIT